MGFDKAEVPMTVYSLSSLSMLLFEVLLSQVNRDTTKQETKNWVTQGF